MKIGRRRLFKWLASAPLIGAAAMSLGREDGVWFENPEVVDSQIAELPYDFRVIDEYNDLLGNNPKVLR